MMSAERAPVRESHLAMARLGGDTEDIQGPARGVSIHATPAFARFQRAMPQLPKRFSRHPQHPGRLAHSYLHVGTGYAVGHDDAQQQPQPTAVPIATAMPSQPPQQPAARTGRLLAGAELLDRQPPRRLIEAQLRHHGAGRLDFPLTDTAIELGDMPGPGEQGTKKNALSGVVTPPPPPPRPHRGIVTPVVHDPTEQQTQNAASQLGNEQTEQGA